MLSQTKPTPEIIAKYNAGKALLKANPSILDGKIGELSAAAQGPAKKFRDLLLVEDADLEKFMSGGNAIKAGCTASVRNELEGFKFDFAEVLGLWDTS
ncbi:hypothetical protein PRIPAC_70030 [Pristionchus pacificus]|uniref:Uncharacterized protein n=1 Tax=Pristionchus pacificus TaxID=54126 RepID=A0A2A6CSF3_PRIPA|nr:hypothetical protein PRIPAC_70030 [Pristionchus pacificus]|eukprot:PDM80997.1 hypothetical protein PRIPAC_36000 [Pristionchus pacificus]